MPDKVRVFVSHSHKDGKFTDLLVSDLKAAGADVWVDSEEIASDDFISRINEGLRDRQWLVLVMTPDAISPRWVNTEVNAALDRTHKGLMQGVIPFVAKACPEDQIPPLWGPLHRYDATAGYEKALAGLMRALGLHGRRQSVAQQPPGSPLFPGSQSVSRRSPPETPMDLSRSFQAPPRLHAWPLRLDFGVLVSGQVCDLELEVANRGKGLLAGRVESSSRCISVYPDEFDFATTHLNVHVDTQGLTAGVHTCHITIRSNGGSQTLPIRFSVRP